MRGRVEVKIRVKDTSEQAFAYEVDTGRAKSYFEAVRTLKSLVSRRIGRPVFQKGFYDHAVRDDEDLRALARYLVANPVRAGLVDRVNDYPHWDAVWLDGE